jgi:hypothetical protein
MTTVRFTQGSVGRFDFSTVNSLLEAADMARTAVTGRDTTALRQKKQAFLARLTTDLGRAWFTPTPTTGSDGQPGPPTLHSVWDWEYMGVGNLVAPYRLTAPLNREKSTMWPSGGIAGRAVLVRGMAQVGDLVLLTPVVTEAGLRLFVFLGREAAIGSASLLRIDGSEPTDPDPDQNRAWIYTVTPVRITRNGGVEEVPELPQGTARNAYEYTNPDWGHGQQLEWPDVPQSKMRINGPVSGIVHGVLQEAPTVAAPAFWAFDAPVPLKPQCITDPFGVQSASMVIERGMA